MGCLFTSAVHVCFGFTTKPLLDEVGVPDLWTRVQEKRGITSHVPASLTSIRQLLPYAIKLTAREIVEYF
jgi:hypothetical protein